MVTIAGSVCLLAPHDVTPSLLCMWESFSWKSDGRNDWFTVHEGYLVTHMKFWKDVTFLTLRNSPCDPNLRQTAVLVYQNTFRVNLTTTGCSRKFRINTGRPHSGLMDCNWRQAFITHIAFRLTLEEKAMYSYGERCHCNLWDQKTLTNC